MIIACPNCTGPYQLADDQVAPLVQVQCPHCEYRIILDFAAADDESLRDPETQLAACFANTGDLQSFLGDGYEFPKYDLPAQPKLAAVPTPAPVTEPKPRVAAT
ncbi:MAG TPA: zinc-ribbon domain-containing protein, partial [Nannocystaceae bacterium]|nr:zinc-ribbon domain-containing protein [Nannocystaceae bacterium]